MRLPAAALLVSVIGCATPETNLFKDTSTSSAGGSDSTSSAGGSGAGGTGGEGGSASSSSAGLGWESGTRLRAVYLEGDDGARQPSGWMDSERNERCSVSVTSDGKSRCIPSGMSVSGYFSDVGCTSPLASLPDSCSSPPSYIIHAITANCETTRRVYTTGITYSVGAVYVGGPGQCVVGTRPNGQTLYLFGAEVPADEFVELTEQVE